MIGRTKGSKKGRGGGGGCGREEKGEGKREGVEKKGRR